MNDAPTDSMFKLRLPGQLREKLEREAQAKGRTLTAEILARLGDTFSTNPDRISELEKVVFSKKNGNEALLLLADKLMKRISSLEVMLLGFSIQRGIKMEEEEEEEEEEE